ncbi:ABC transporter permease [Planomonospora sp. ID82291]|uniref:ABC transporter permease n=1 Tax=Planomonospora sp. ID82291 TaxID=2738136 RepID=UPI0018C37852|nr:ABC transporter permease [Planomonospora sp. ID82291]MBG0813061.1 ABC transporter permease [Planomonospora sp. ID82291]
MTGTATPFRRLLAVEARKLVDTRSGTALALALVVLVVAAVAVRGAVAGPELQRLITTAGIGSGTLLPVLGILTMTGEWSHRTALTTFTLEPRRGRVLAAKCLPALAAAVAACPLAVLAAVPATAVAAAAQGVPAVWEVDPAALLGWTGVNVLLVAEGLAMGALLLNAPAAIVICLASPMAWAAVGRLGATGATLAEWLDLNTTTGPLMSGGLSGDGAVRLAVSVLVWIVVPMAAGAARVVRKDVR